MSGAIYMVYDRRKVIHIRITRKSIPDDVYQAVLHEGYKRLMREAFDRIHRARALKGLKP